MSKYVNEPEPKCVECGQFCEVETVQVNRNSHKVSGCCKAPVIHKGKVLEDKEE